MNKIYHRGGFRRRGEVNSPPSYFLQSLAFFNHFEEIKTALFEAELIIGNTLITDY